MMSKSMLSLIKILLLTLMLVGTPGSAANATSTASNTPAPAQKPSLQVTAPAVDESLLRPVRLRIPAIDVDAEIEAVGQTRGGAMDVPTEVDDVAWYELGAIPGEIGNAVIAGHLDRVSGAPAVFWNLDDLKEGDDVYVIDGQGTEHHFRVIRGKSYPYNKSPIAEIFGFTLGSHLNLITCRGTWDRGRQTYSNRYVVYTELVESTPAE